MGGRSQRSSILGILVLAATWAASLGCVGDQAFLDSWPPPPEDQVSQPAEGPAPPPDARPPDPIPRELAYASLPPYQLEPPDILLINMLRVVPKPPYKIEALDALLVQATGTLANAPIAGQVSVDPDGTINLGPAYGLVRVAGLTLEEAQKRIQKFLEDVALRNPRVTVSLAAAHGMQQIQGEHLVRPDGTVGLGVYGSVYVSGLTLEQARSTIETQLSRSLLDPEISIDVFSYNSKYCYVIADGAGYGQQIVRLPFTGKETVLDAISQIYGLPQVSSAKIWVARPNGRDPDHWQMLPVNWHAITIGGSPATNYQLFPGDRVYIKANILITVNNRLAQLFAPLERVMGITLLGAATVNAVTNATTKNGAFGAPGF